MTTWWICPEKDCDIIEQTEGPVEGLTHRHNRSLYFLVGVSSPSGAAYIILKKRQERDATNRPIST